MLVLCYSPVGVSCMSVALFAGDRVEECSIAGRRMSAQHVVVTLFVIEVALLFLCAVVPSLRLEAFGVSTYVHQEQFEAQVGGALIGVAVYVIAACLFPVSSAAHIFDARLNTRRLVFVCLATFGTLVALAAAMKTTQSYSRVWFFTWCTSATVLILFVRLCGLVWVRWKLLRGTCVFRAISIGLGAQPLTPERLLVHTGYKTRVIKSTKLANIADLDPVVDLIRKEKADQIYISASWSRLPELASKIEKLRFLAVDIFLHCDDEQLRGHVLNVSDLDGGLAFQAGFCPITGWDEWFKRCEDIIFSIAILAITWPVLAITALAIKLESPGPIFFRQIREGLNGSHFELLKFRSMYTDKTDLHAAQQTAKDDPRVTRVGRIIRKLSIDELPQLFNVLTGSMSLVGPRPHALKTRAEGKALDDVVDYYASRHRVKSGITGWAQVNGFREELDTTEKLKARVDCDLYYIRAWSVWLDLKILIRTAGQMLFDPRAY